MNDFAGWLRRERKALGLTQSGLGDCAGCTAITIKKLEAGDRKPSRELALRLAQCLGLPPSEHDEFVRFARGRPPNEAEQQAPVARDGAPPALMNRFIGRERELEQLELLLLGDGRRLVTILGPPGVGKTRLALQAGRRLEHRFADGVRWIDLSPVQDPALVAFAIRRGLALPESTLPWRSDLEQLIALLAEQSLLLVLDNCEQAGDMSAVLEAMLAQIAGLSVVATSRQPLHVYGEQSFPIAPLPVAGPSLNRLGETSPAAALFLARAREIAPHLQMRAGSAEMVEALCRRLDGLPLAIELAAAQLRYRALPSVLDQAGINSLDLAPGPPDGPGARPLSLRAVIERSLRLLTRPQQELLARLSVFVNGWQAEAAAVFGTRRALDRLVDANLVQLEWGAPDGERFTFLEVTRAFAAERLEAMGAVDAARESHAGYFARLAAEAASELHTPALPLRQARLALESANFDSALAWCRANNPRLGLEIAVYLWEFWYLWGEYHAGVAHLLAFLELNPERDRLRGRALRGAGVLLTRQTQFAEAGPHFAESLQIGTELGATDINAAAHMGLADCSIGIGDWSAARPNLEAAHQIFVELENALGRSWALSGLAKAALILDEDTQAAADLMTDCVRYARAAGDPRHLGWMLAVMADFQREIGATQAAHETILEALEVLQSLGDIPGLAYAHLRLGAVYRVEGRTGAAIAQLLQSVELALRSHTLSYARQALALLALLMVAERDDALGTQILAASLAELPALSERLPGPDRRELDEALTALPVRMGREAFDHHWQRGGALTLSKARALAAAWYDVGVTSAVGEIAG